MGLDRRYWRRRCLIAGLVLLAITIALLPWNPTRGCGPSSVTPPIIAFELATDRGALAALFGPPGPCRDALAADLRIVNIVDYLFMTTYGAMLVAALVAIGARRWLIAAAVIAPSADAIENLSLLRLDIDAPGAWLAILAVASRTKFVLLGVVSFSIAVATWRGESRRLRWLAIAHVPALPAAIVGCVAPAASPVMMPAIAASWLALTAWAALRRDP